MAFRVAVPGTRASTMKVAAQPAEPVSSMTRPLVPATSTRPGPKDAIARRFSPKTADGTLIRHQALPADW
jgi:hypothetical protein